MNFDAHGWRYYIRKAASGGWDWWVCRPDLSRQGQDTAATEDQARACALACLAGAADHPDYDAEAAATDSSARPGG
jgi:hypothetical protein